MCSTGDSFAIPMVNVYGVLQHSRYLPDRRDWNRSFPGSERGSLAARLADLFMSEIVKRCTHGIDLHTGANHRSNLPQIRAALDDPETLRLTRRFGVPVLINSVVRDGSLREAAAAHGIPMLLYEAGEALRFNELAIRAGVQGILEVMRGLGMLTPPKTLRRARGEPCVARSSSWVRAPESGVFRANARLGALLENGARVGVVAEPFGDAETEVCSEVAGIVIGVTNLPIVHQGDALFHVARFTDPNEVAQQLEVFHASYEPETSTDIPQQ